MKKLILILFLITGCLFAQRNPTIYSANISTTNDTLVFGSIDNYTVTIQNISRTSTDSIFVYAPITSSGFNSQWVCINANDGSKAFDIYAKSIIVKSNNTAVPIKYWTGNIYLAPALTVTINGFVASDSVTALRASIDALLDSNKRQGDSLIILRTEINAMKASAISVTSYGEGYIPQVKSGVFTPTNLDSVLQMKWDSVWNFNHINRINLDKTKNLFFVDCGTSSVGDTLSIDSTMANNMEITLIIYSNGGAGTPYIMINNGISGTYLIYDGETLSNYYEININHSYTFVRRYNIWFLIRRCTLKN